MPTVTGLEFCRLNNVDTRSYWRPGRIGADITPALTPPLSSDTSEEKSDQARG